jgi:Transglutaminase-like superfamily
MLGFAAPPSSLSGIPEGIAGTRATLKVMSRLVKQFKVHPSINLFAGGLVQHLREYDEPGEISALQHFVRDQIRYLKDIVDVETVRDPLVTLEHGFGDCDDKSVLMCTLAATIGYETQFLAIGFDGVNFSHVLAAVKLGTRWIPCETIKPGVEPGWFPQGVSNIYPYRNN